MLEDAQPDAFAHLRERVLYIDQMDNPIGLLEGLFQALERHIPSVDRGRASLTLSASPGFTANVRRLEWRRPRRYEIVLSLGFVGMLRDALEFWLVRMVVVSPEGELRQGLPMTVEQSTTIMARNIRTFFARNSWGPSEFDIVRINRAIDEVHVPLSQRRSSIGEFHEQQAFLFVLAHELAHLVFRHPGTSAKNRRDSWNRELACDRWAIDLVLSDVGNPGKFLGQAEAARQLWIVGLLAAVGLVSAVQKLLDDAKLALTHKVDDDYPPPMERFLALKKHLLSKGVAESTFSTRTTYCAEPEPFIEIVLSSFNVINWNAISPRGDAEMEELKSARDTGRLRLVEACLAYSIQQWMPPFE